MGSFKAKIRLYRRLDRDLMALYRNPDFCLVRAMQEAVTMAARNEGGYIALPEPIHLTSYPKKLEFNVTLPDDDVVAWYRMIPEGYRNDTLKNLIRGYLSGPVIGVAIGKSGFDNIDYFNGQDKDFRTIKNTERTSLEARQYAEIEKLLKASGSTPETLLKQLKEVLPQEAENSIVRDTPAEKNPPAKAVSAPPKEEPQKTEEVVENSDFDVFSAVSSMM